MALLAPVYDEDDLTQLHRVPHTPVKRGLSEFVGIGMVPARLLQDVLRAELDEDDDDERLTPEYRRWRDDARRRHHIVRT